MRAPYKVILVGTGGIGQPVLRELIRRPEFEVVGVLVFSRRKDGLDVGELAGGEPLGLKATTDPQAVLDQPADCVVWCGYFPLPHVAEKMDKLVIQMLASGKNVVTPACYHYPHLHGEAYVKRFEDACRQGNSCLHGTGENPGFWFERLALTLTGLCNEVEYIKLDEYCNLAITTGDEKMWKAAGFGVTVEEAEELATYRETWNKHYFIETLNLASMSLYGKTLDRFEFDSEHHVCEEAFELSQANGDPFDMAFAKGTVMAVTHSFHGYVDGQRRLYAACNNFLSPAHSPFGDKKDSTWDIEIEGRPTSIRCNVAAQASFRDNLIFYPGDSTSPLYYASIAPIVQAIPVVCGHEAGIVYPSTFASCAADLRCTRNSKICRGPMMTPTANPNDIKHLICIICLLRHTIAANRI